MKKGILKFTCGREEVILFFPNGTHQIFNNLDNFLNFDFGTHGIQIFTTKSELNAIYNYLKEENSPNYSFKLGKLHEKKVFRLSFHKQDDRNPEYAKKTIYDIKYKIGSDELELKDALKLIDELNCHSSQGYTAKLKKEIKLEERVNKVTLDSPPSMAPIVYAKTLVEFINVQCADITSAYPYLLTQKLPHYFGEVGFTSEEMLNDENFTYYGGIRINKLEAKTSYYPLTLVGKNNKKITVEKQGIGIVHHGVRIEKAEQVTLYGFIPHLLEILKNNYNYESYQISKKLVKYELKIDCELRNIMLKQFERKQTKKRAGLSYTGEKILLNRIYGFLITKGSTSPAHYGQYIVSKERLIIDRIIREIGIKDIVQSHTDSIKFIGNHWDVIEKYNRQIEFPELGRFTNEGVLDKCVYYSNITAKYLKEGKLGFKHGGIDKKGIEMLYCKNYNSINQKTKFFLISGYFYVKGEGYFPNCIVTDFSRSVDDEGDDR